MYVFDNAPLSTLFRNYYRKRFPSLWEKYDALVADGQIVSTREVLREIEDVGIESLHGWCADNGHLFPSPTADEARAVASIYLNRNFQHNIEQQKLLKGGKCADPFVVAKAIVEKKTVVTMEVLKPNSARIPNICDHFKIRCISLEFFMEEQGWVF